MNEKYSDCIETVSKILFETISKREENLNEKILEIDTDLLSLLRAKYPGVEKLMYVTNYEGTNLTMLN